MDGYHTPSNMLNELDKKPEKRGLNFVRWTGLLIMIR